MNRYPKTKTPRPGKRLLVLALLLTSLPVSSCRPHEPGEPKTPTELSQVSIGPPNVLLISIDTLRADHMSVYGYERETTPFLESFAARGTLFSRAFVNTHGTPQSHATMLTSLAQETHRVGFPGPAGGEPSFVVPQSLTLLPEIFQEEGYRTMAITGGGFVSPKFGFDQGFDQFKLQEGIKAQSRWLRRVLSEPTTDERPLFVFFHTYEVHSPYTSPEAYQDLFGEYDSDFVPTSENLGAVGNRVAEELTLEDLESIKAHYDRGIRFADQQLRRLMTALEEIGFLDNTVVLLTSDHGEEFGERGRLLHPGSLYDELLHVPLLLVHPGGPRRVVEDRLVTTMDIAPTLLSLAGLPIPHWMQGDSLVDSIDRPDPPNVAYSQFGPWLLSVRTERWKLIGWKESRLALFDLERDPGETEDVSREHTEVVRTLRRQLEEWRRSQPRFEDVTAGNEVPEVPELTSEEESRLRNLGYL